MSAPLYGTLYECGCWTGGDPRYHSFERCTSHDRPWKSKYFENDQVILNDEPGRRVWETERRFKP